MIAALLLSLSRNTMLLVFQEFHEFDDVFMWMRVSLSSNGSWKVGKRGRLKQRRTSDSAFSLDESDPDTFQWTIHAKQDSYLTVVKIHTLAETLSSQRFFCGFRKDTLIAHAYGCFWWHRPEKSGWHCELVSDKSEYGEATTFVVGPVGKLDSESGILLYGTCKGHQDQLWEMIAQPTTDRLATGTKKKNKDKRNLKPCFRQ
jgi:hypothetical protein